MMTLQQIKAILFDMDGTLINSEDIYIKQLNSILATHFSTGPLSESVKLAIQGRPGRRICEIIVEAYGLQDQTTGAAFYALTNAKAQLELFRECLFLPGIQEFLIRIKQDYNVPIAIATSTTRLKYDAKTRHLQRDGFALFDATVTGGDHPELPKERGKPHPDIWHLALRETNAKLGLIGAPGEIRIEDCLIFEDSVSGIESAIRSGGRSVWIPSNKNVIGLLSDNERAYYEDKCEAILESFLDFDSGKYGW